MIFSFLPPSNPADGGADESAAWALKRRQAQTRAGEMGDRGICYTINYSNGDAAGGKNGSVYNEVRE